MLARAACMASEVKPMPEPSSLTRTPMLGLTKLYVFYFYLGVNEMHAMFSYFFIEKEMGIYRQCTERSCLSASIQ